MSLDVYLRRKWYVQEQAGPRIFIREEGETKEISRAEWGARFPDREPVTVEVEETDCVYGANITHNLTKMAREAGLYEALWRPDEHGLTHARQLVEPLRAGLARLWTDPAYFQTFNPENGWGNYDLLCRFVTGYLAACERWPAAEVSVSR